MDTHLLLPWIQECIREERFYVEDHAMESHPVQEGFRIAQAVESILHGEIVSRRPDDGISVVCGSVAGLQSRDEYHGNFIHTVVNYDRTSKILIITMYRPRIDTWETPRRRRR